MALDHVPTNADQVGTSSDGPVKNFFLNSQTFDRPPVYRSWVLRFDPVRIFALT